MTHLLLATLVASSLDAGLALLVIVGVVILVAAARAAFEVRRDAGASLSLGGAVAVAGAGRARRTLSGGSPAGDRGPVHAAPVRMSKGWRAVKAANKAALAGRTVGRYSC